MLKEGEKATAEELIEFCRQRLSSFKRPRSVVFADELPRTSTGKVLKRVLREKYGHPFQIAMPAAYILDGYLI